MNTLMGTQIRHQSTHTKKKELKQENKLNIVCEDIENENKIMHNNSLVIDQTIDDIPPQFISKNSNDESKEIEFY